MQRHIFKRVICLNKQSRYFCKSINHHVKTNNFPQVKQLIDTSNDLNKLLEIAEQEKQKIISQRNRVIKNPEYMNAFTESGLMATFNWGTVGLIGFELWYSNLGFAGNILCSVFLFLNGGLGIVTGLRTLCCFIQLNSRKRWHQRYLSIRKIQNLLSSYQKNKKNIKIKKKYE